MRRSFLGPAFAALVAAYPAAVSEVQVSNSNSFDSLPTFSVVRLPGATIIDPEQNGKAYVCAFNGAKRFITGSDYDQPISVYENNDRFIVAEFARNGEPSVNKIFISGTEEEPAKVIPLVGKERKATAGEEFAYSAARDEAVEACMRKVGGKAQDGVVTVVMPTREVMPKYAVGTANILALTADRK